MRARASYILTGILTCSLFVGCTSGEQTSNGSRDNSSGPVEIIPEILVEMLPLQLHETSGLIQYKNLVWTMNDSGGEPAIYGFDMDNEEVRQVIYIENGENNDWESLTSDEDHIYIGDFGNNWGWRKDLKVYIINKSDIPENQDAGLTAGIIEFVYPDQEEFVFGINSNPFDCEAFICLDRTLYLFTKDWVTRNTKVYSLPASPGSYTAELVDSFNVDGLETGADLSQDRQKLILLGYKEYIPFHREES